MVPAGTGPSRDQNGAPQPEAPSLSCRQRCPRTPAPAQVGRPSQSPGQTRPGQPESMRGVGMRAGQQGRARSAVGRATGPQSPAPPHAGQLWGLAHSPRRVPASAFAHEARGGEGGRLPPRAALWALQLAVSRQLVGRVTPLWTWLSLRDTATVCALGEGLPASPALSPRPRNMPCSASVPLGSRGSQRRCLAYRLRTEGGPGPWPTTAPRPLWARPPPAAQAADVASDPLVPVASLLVSSAYPCCPPARTLAQH